MLRSECHVIDNILSIASTCLYDMFFYQYNEDALATLLLQWETLPIERQRTQRLFIQRILTVITRAN